MRAIAAFATIVAASLLWLNWPARPLVPAAIVAAEYGERTDAGLIAVEPSLSASDYRSAEALRAALARYLDIAKERGWLTAKGVVVFPEHVGTWLAAAQAPAVAYRASSINVAMIAIIADDPFSFGLGLIKSTERDRFAAALFRARGRKMAKDYQEVFSALARDYGATIVAGSIVLENPVVENGRLTTRRGDLYNVSAIIRADGAIEPDLVFKKQPIPSEAGFIKAGSGDNPTFATPAGMLGVLVCADSWHPELYAALAGAELVAAPAYLQANDGWTAPWGGYVTPQPEDVDDKDVGALTEGEAWRKYAMPSRLLATRADAGVTAFLRGAPWDLGADGRALLYARSALHVGDAHEGGGVSVVWR